MYCKNFHLNWNRNWKIQSLCGIKMCCWNPWISRFLKTTQITLLLTPGALHLGFSGTFEKMLPIHIKYISRWYEFVFCMCFLNYNFCSGMTLHNSNRTTCNYLFMIIVILYVYYLYVFVLLCIYNWSFFRTYKYIGNIEDDHDLLYIQWRCWRGTYICDVGVDVCT